MKKLILAFSILCFGAAALILILMPKPERTLPPLPEANYEYDLSGIEYHSKKIRKITKYPRITSDYEYGNSNHMFSVVEVDDFNRLAPSNTEDDSVSYMMNVCNVTLAAGDYMSFRMEGSFHNVTTNEHDFFLTSHNFCFIPTEDFEGTDGEKIGKEIGFADVISNFSAFEKAFIKGKFTMVKNDDYLDEKSSAEMLLNYSPVNEVYPDWYTDGEYFYVIAQGPAALGGLTEYKIHLLDAEDFLNVESGIFEMIFTEE